MYVCNAFPECATLSLNVLVGEPVFQTFILGHH